MVENEKDLVESMALRIAAKDILNINLNKSGYVRFDDAVRRAVRMMRPDLLMAREGIAANDIRCSIDNIFYNKNRSHENQFFMTPPSQEPLDEQVICSIHCSIWNTCSLRNGGYPCRIQAVGYIKQKAN